jgi:hypothetical protein
VIAFHSFNEVVENVREGNNGKKALVPVIDLIECEMLERSG